MEALEEPDEPEELEETQEMADIEETKWAESAKLTAGRIRLTPRSRPLN